MTIGESNDVNILLQWLLGGLSARPQVHWPVSDTDARDAAARLASRAHNTLMAGVDSTQVHARWQGRIPGRREIAASAGVSERTAGKARKLLQERPDLHTRVCAGEMSLAAADRERRRVCKR